MSGVLLNLWSSDIVHTTVWTSHTSVHKAGWGTFCLSSLPSFLLCSLFLDGFMDWCHNIFLSLFFLTTSWNPVKLCIGIGVPSQPFRLSSILYRHSYRVIALYFTKKGLEACIFKLHLAWTHFPLICVYSTADPVTDCRGGCVQGIYIIPLSHSLSIHFVHPTHSHIGEEAVMFHGHLWLVFCIFFKPSVTVVVLQWMQNLLFINLENLMPKVVSLWSLWC